MVSNFQYHISTRARHFRYLFFIDETYSGAELRKLMEMNLQLWGGRYNPIVPVEKNQIPERYKAVISYFDPDIIFYSSQVDIEEVKKQIPFNPEKFINLNNPVEFRIYGVSSLYFLNAFENISIRPLNIGNISDALKDFYSLNFCITDETYKHRVSEQNEIHHIDAHIYNTINEYISKRKVFFRSILSAINLNTVILRNTSYSTHYFEIIISDRKDSIKDLLYFWNRQLFVSRSNLNQIILSVDELDELLKDEAFGNVLKRLALESSINITSQSLPTEILQNIISEKLQKCNRFISYHITANSDFPFDILDSNGLFQRNFGEKINKLLFAGNKGLLYFPPLGFSTDVSGKWVIDLEFEKNDDFLKQHLKFSKRLEHHYFLNIDGRINRRGNISLFVNSSEENVELKIPVFEQIIKQMISSPKIFGKKIDSRYKYVQTSNDGIRLSAFIKLFNGNLSHIEDIIYDKFWHDIIVKLSSNTKIIGDTIYFDEIIECCIGEMSANGIVLSSESSYKNRKNLEAGVRNILEDLCECGIFFIGYNIGCRECSSKFWYNINDVRDVFICKGCGVKQRFPIENQLAYKLNDLVKNNFCSRDSEGKLKPDGNLTVLKTILRFHRKGIHSFEYCTQLDLFDDFYRKPITDLDVICQVNGKLILGESKHSSKGFKEEGHKSLTNLVEIAKFILPEKIIISCSVDANNKLEKMKQYLIHEMKDVPIIIDAFKVSEPYYQFESNGYFLR